MKDNSFDTAPKRENSKGKNLLLSLAFCVLAVCAVLVIFRYPAVTLQNTASASGAPTAQPTPDPVQTPAPSPEAAESVPEETAREVIDLADFGGYPTKGKTYGTLKISGTSVDCALYYGDDDPELNAGAGTYTDACIPGEDGTILIAGHTGTYFRDFVSLQVGADIEIETYYGTFHYEVTGMQPALATDSAAYDLTATPENIILYTCYPLGKVAPTDWRYFVYGKLTSGPLLAEGQP